MSRHTQEWTFNFQSMIYTVYEEVFSVNSGIFPRDMFTIEAQHNVFWYDTLSLYFGI